MNDDPGKTRLVVGASDAIWPVIILAVGLGAVISLAQFAGGFGNWTFIGTLTLIAVCVIQRVVLTREGVRITLIIPFLSKNIRWSQVRRVGLCDNERTVLICMENDDAVLISTWFLRCSAKELASTCVQWYEFNRTRTCRACGYDLYGIESPACPECGEPLEREKTP